MFAEEFSLNWVSFLTQYQKKLTSLHTVGKTGTVLMTQIANFITLCQRSLVHYTGWKKQIPF
jgi:hypothetical protein